jgi:hypothetical protein
VEKKIVRGVKEKMISNYTTSLATHLYNRIDTHQNNPVIKRTRPMTWPAGLYFTATDLTKWIAEHDISEAV